MGGSTDAAGVLALTSMVPAMWASAVALINTVAAVTQAPFSITSGPPVAVSCSSQMPSTRRRVPLRTSTRSPEKAQTGEKGEQVTVTLGEKKAQVPLMLLSQLRGLLQVSTRGAVWVVGTRVGRVVGLMEGWAEGCEVGCLLGCPVGWWLGRWLGCLLGCPVGDEERVGRRLGWPLGWPVGSCTGLAVVVGDADGRVLGAALVFALTEGAGLGKGVGATVLEATAASHSTHSAAHRSSSCPALIAALDPPARFFEWGGSRARERCFITARCPYRAPRAESENPSGSCQRIIDCRVALEGSWALCLGGRALSSLLLS